MAVHTVDERSDLALREQLAGALQRGKEGGLVRIRIQRLADLNFDRNVSLKTFVINDSFPNIVGIPEHIVASHYVANVKWEAVL